MPFGLTIAPTTFQSLMNDIFRPFLRRFMLVFFDDILVYSRSCEDHATHLHQVFQVLAAHKLHINRKKYQFEKTTRILGQLLSANGVQAEATKIDAMLNCLPPPPPTNLKGLRGFLGLTGYYQRFMKNYTQKHHH